MTKTRVVISGMAALTPVGHSLKETYSAITRGESGIGPIQAWDCASWDYQIGAALKNFDARKALPDRKLLKLLSPYDVYGLNVIPEALSDCGWLDYRDSLADPNEFNDKTGIYVGSPGNKYYQQYDYLPLLSEAKGDLHYFGENVTTSVNPMWLLQILPNNVLAYAGIQYGFKGANQNIVNHGVSGLQAIIEAYHAILTGQIDRALVVAYESLFDPQSLLYYSAIGTTSATGLRPFDVSRDGMVIGEGAGALTLETFEAANARGAPIYAEILAGATIGEHAGIFSIEEDGSGISAVLEKTLHSARLKSRDLGAICAHGNGTVLSDHSEANGIARVLGDHVVPVTGYKWALGHTLTASGVIDTAITACALRDQILPGIANLKTIAPECAQIAVSAETQKITTPITAILARGFASLNSCLLLSGVA